MQMNNFVEIIAEELQLSPTVIEADRRLDDLGMQSIDVVQVVQRVEATLGHAIDDLDLSSVETVADFLHALVPPADVAALALASAQTPARAPAPTMATTGPEHHQALVTTNERQAAVTRWLGEDPLADAQTLTDMLHRRVLVSPDREAFRFDEVPCTYAHLWADVERAARLLRAAGIGPRDRVVLVLPNGPEFLPLFHGLGRLRAVAVPVFHLSGPERIAAITRQCGARLVIMPHELEEPSRSALDQALPPNTELRAASTLMRSPPPDDPRPLPRPEPDDLAMLQYTSGTTGASKGVMLTHGALMANIRQIVPATRFHSRDVVVSWLPVYHDMGLITMTMCPIYVGARLVMLPISLRPDAWLDAITRHRGTMTAAPDFAYRYAIRFAGSAGRYDLTSLRFGLIAAEPVRASTIETFERKFGIRGVLRPGYGLAEACVGVAFWPFSRSDLAVDRDGFVSVGRPLPDIELQIRDGERALPPGERGEICFRSPSQTLGYFRDPAATAAGRTADGLIRTGDLGYLDEAGDLTVVGRLKELIIVAGRNLAPKEIEEIAESVDGVAGCMALGIDDGGDAGELLHLFVESRAPQDRYQSMAQQIGTRVRAQLGLRPDRIHVVPRRTISRTYNGKLQYAQMRARYLADPGAFEA